MCLCKFLSVEFVAVVASAPARVALSPFPKCFIGRLTTLADPPPPPAPPPLLTLPPSSPYTSTLPPLPTPLVWEQTVADQLRQDTVTSPDWDSLVAGHAARCLHAPLGTFISLHQTVALTQR